MKKTLTAVVACAAIFAPVAGADVNGSIQKLSGDASSYHAMLLADAQKLVFDAQSLTASATATKDKTAGRALLMADLAKLKTDLQATHAALEADRSRLKADVQALKGTKPGNEAVAALKTALQQLQSSSQGERNDVQSAAQLAKQALEALKASFKK